MKMPPIEKVYEAWTALADGRVTDLGCGRYTVASSDGTRSYTVVYDPETDTFASDDSATFWRGYPGYPVLAVMMLTGMLPYSHKEAALWGGVNWNRLNAAHKRDYAAAVTQIGKERGIDAEESRAEAIRVMDRLARLRCDVKRYYAPRKTT